ncbi:unnamed protein product, partial [marine sediment metagenome]
AHDKQIKRLKEFIKEDEKELKDLEQGKCQCVLTGKEAERVKEKIKIRNKELKILESMK